MIISHSLKFIFLALPKSGSNSVRAYLRPFLDEGDDEQCILMGARKSSYSQFHHVKHGHFTAQEIRAVLGRKTWRSYYKFGIVRNPYDRLLSTCAFFLREEPDVVLSPERIKLFVSRQKGRLHMKPQWQFLADDRGNLMTDFVGKIENINHDMAQICERIGVSFRPEEFEHVNQSRHQTVSELFDDDLYRLTNQMYGRDFELFDYKQIR